VARFISGERLMPSSGSALTGSSSDKPIVAEASAAQQALLATDNTDSHVAISSGHGAHAKPNRQGPNIKQGLRTNATALRDFFSFDKKPNCDVPACCDIADESGCRELGSAIKGLCVHVSYTEREHLCTLSNTKETKSKIECRTLPVRSWTTRALRRGSRRNGERD
jgi:hypothetical protein